MTGSFGEIKEKYILFVCDTNTCRSVMAEGFFNEYAKGRINTYALSCGIYAVVGEEPADYTVEVMQAFGIDISGHKAQKVSRRLIEGAYTVVCMTKYIAKLLSDRYPTLKARIAALDPEIPDPYGGDISDYRRAAGMLDDLLSGICDVDLKDIEPYEQK